MKHAQQSSAALALALGVLLRLVPAAAEPPANAPQPRAVRQLGGAQGTKTEVAPVAQPGSAAGSRAALHDAREQARAAMKEAHEAMQKVPKDTQAAVEQARAAMKEAREQARDAMEKAPAQAREEMEDAREEMHKAREQGREALEEAKAAMVKAREQVQQALPGVPGVESRKDQAHYARRLAWHGLMNRVAHPSDIAPPARQELRHHAMRMAKLQRIHALAASKHDAATMARCDKLLAREETRHRTRLSALLPLQEAPKAKVAQDPEEDDPGEAEGPEDEEQEGEP